VELLWQSDRVQRFANPIRVTLCSSTSGGHFAQITPLCEISQLDQPSGPSFRPAAERQQMIGRQYFRPFGYLLGFGGQSAKYFQTLEGQLIIAIPIRADFQESQESERRRG
jgi:hypothetical protein